jgi:hypothetical protein
MFGRNKRGSSSHDHHHVHNQVVQRPINPDLSENGYVGSYGGTSVSFVSASDGQIKERILVVSRSEPAIYVSSTKHAENRAAECAKHHMGEGATVSLDPFDNHAGYILPERSTEISVVGAGVVGVREIAGPLVLTCTSVEGVECPRTDTCSYRADVLRINMHVLGGLATAEVPHYANMSR